MKTSQVRIGVDWAEKLHEIAKQSPRGSVDGTTKEAIAFYIELYETFSKIVQQLPGRSVVGMTREAVAFYIETVVPVLIAERKALVNKMKRQAVFTEEKAS